MEEILWREVYAEHWLRRKIYFSAKAPYIVIRGEPSRRIERAEIWNHFLKP